MALLFGGAIRLGIPTEEFIDASTMRQVPDHQEVWVSKNDPECSIIVELLDAETETKASDSSSLLSIQ